MLCHGEYHETHTCIRVPLADNNLLKVPESLSDEKALFLSDIVCTGWHANELGEALFPFA